MQSLLEFMNRDRLKKYKINDDHQWKTSKINPNYRYKKIGYMEMKFASVTDSFDIVSDQWYVATDEKRFIFWNNSLNKNVPKFILYTTSEHYTWVCVENNDWDFTKHSTDEFVGMAFDTKDFFHSTFSKNKMWGIHTMHADPKAVDILKNPKA